MTHDEIAARNVVECYLMAKLSQDESARFEEHFVDCPECLDQLEAAERLRSALKPLARERGQTELPRTASRHWGSAWPVAAGLVLAAGSLLLFAIREAKVRGELAQAVTASLDWQQRYEREHAAAEALRSAKPAGDAAPAAPVVASTFYLNIARGSESATSEPINRVTLPADPRWIALSLEGEVEAGLKRLRVSVADSAGSAVWQQADLQVTPRETLSVILPSRVLNPGDYVLTLEGLSPSGRGVPAGRYRFRVANR
jgi:hypothetical protein